MRFLVTLLLSAATTHVAPLAFSPRLNRSTQWDLRLELDPAELRTKADRVLPSSSFVIDGVVFDEAENYEPPQGSLTVTSASERGLQLESSRYKLSEDPNERKDSLWIWGLFKDPLYPFLLLEMTTKPFLFGGGDDAEVLPSLKLYIQMGHKMERNKEKRGARSSILSPAMVTMRRTVNVKADLVGLARADIYEEKVVGKITINNPSKTNPHKK